MKVKVFDRDTLLNMGLVPINHTGAREILTFKDNDCYVVHSNTYNKTFEVARSAIYRSGDIRMPAYDIPYRIYENSIYDYKWTIPQIYCEVVDED